MNPQNDNPMVDLDLTGADLGPLAWVGEELRKSMEASTKALRRFARDAQAQRGSDLAAIDTSQLRMARNQIHQAVGALEMVGLAGPCVLLRAMEDVVAYFVDKPQHCTEQAAQTVEGVSFAIMEYLDATIASRAHPAVALFPQFREIRALAGQTQAHPADLWSHKWTWADIRSLLTPADFNVEPVAGDAAARARLDQSVLAIMRGNAREGGALLCGVAQSLSGAQGPASTQSYWQIVAAFGQALQTGALQSDLYVKRALPAVVQQFVSLSKGGEVSERAVRDLLFFCAQADAAVLESVGAAWALAVIRAYRLGGYRPVDYEKSVYGNYDPAQLVAGRKRLGSAKETWSAFTAGDRSKAKTCHDHLTQVSESLVRLHPASQPLADGLRRVAQTVGLTEQTPTAEMAMEVATSILFLEVVFEDFNPADPLLAQRTQELANRLAVVDAGGSSPPLLSWMEELYHRFSERGTLGSVVGELRNNLSDLEKNLDLYFRDGSHHAALADAPARLTQMRGVLSVLGLDQATQAVMRIRDWVEEILKGNVSHDAASVPGGYFDKIGNSLGALGFQIDMLGYQPSLAKKLFLFDAESGELVPTMGRAAAPDVSLEGAVPDGVATMPAPTGFPAATGFAPAVPVPLPVSTEPDAEEDDLLSIFLEEAAEVIQNGQGAIAVLRNNPADMELRTSLRRAFHTLKGSSRMVGLSAFGEAAWALEQAHNASLADPGPCSEALLDLSTESLTALSKWAVLIARGGEAAVQPIPDAFRASADALRLDGRHVALVLPPELAGEAPPAQEPGHLHEAAQFLPESDALPEHVDFAATQPMVFAALPEEPAPLQAIADLEFGFDLTPPPAPVPVVEGDNLISSEAPVGFALDTAPEAVEILPVEPVVRVEDVLSEIELDLDMQADAASVSAEEGQSLPAVEVEEIELDAVLFDLPVEAVQAESVVVVADEAILTEDAVPPILAEEDPVKVVGDLRVNLALYNVYLSEADEWSRQLLADLTETAMQVYATPSEWSVAWAHSLAGSSATVGFDNLSQLARELEYALIQSQRQGAHSPQLMQLFVDAAEAIRHSLHQFAAGLMPRLEEDLLEALRQAQTLVVASIVQPKEPAVSVPPSEPVQLGVEESQEEPVSLDFPAESESGLGLEMEPGPAIELPDLAPVELAEGPAVAQPALDATALAADVAAEIEDDIDVADAIDPDLFPIFEEEAQELMPSLGAALRQWSARADNLGARSEALRLMHTLKGSARLAGALRLGEMIHRLESEVEHLGSAASGATLEPLVGEFDRIAEIFEALRARDAQAYQQALDMAREPAPPVSGGVSTVASEPRPAAAAGTEEVVATPVPVAPSTALSRVTAPGALAVRGSSHQSVRVRANLLDRMVNQAGEVMMTRSRLESELGNLRGSLTDLTANLDKLRQQLRDIELQAETQMQSRMALSREAQANFDPLEFDRYTRVQELTRMMAESVNDVATVQRNLDRALQATEDNLMMQARQTRELQSDLLRTRMVEFEGISERLYRVVRLASKETGKQVRLDITGGQIEMDRGMLDRLTPAFEHLLRNCVAHGIEDAARRQLAGKDPAGLVSIALMQEGNDVNIEFRDDGAGLNLERIRDKAVSMGLMQPHDTLSVQQAGDLIFTPGFSTASEITELAGRGIGMDVVRSEILALGGRIDTQSEFGKGTSFKLVLPLTTAVTQVVMIRSGELVLGVPSTLIEIVRRTTPRELELAYNGGQLELAAGDSVPFFWSGALLQASQRSMQPVGRSTPVVVFRSAAQRVALHVDEVLGNQEVVVKNLGAQLSRLPGLAGMTILPSGAVVLIYNPVALATVYGQQARAWSADHAEAHVLGEVTELHPVAASSAMVAAPASQPKAKAMPGTPLVLVVDDSITVRKVTQRLLQREGYRVVLAADGLQALERLQEETPSLVLSDIEMPRMDGFDLARNIRGDAKTQHLPIVMITSRIAEKHREHARALGVDHYLGKPYSEEELLSLVKRYCAEEATV